MVESVKWARERFLGRIKKLLTTNCSYAKVYKVIEEAEYPLSP